MNITIYSIDTERKHCILFKPVDFSLPKLRHMLRNHYLMLNGCHWPYLFFSFDRVGNHLRYYASFHYIHRFLHAEMHAFEAQSCTKSLRDL